MYIIFDQWLGFLCDAPTEYMKYPDILDFLANVPTVWDKTLPLDARLGEYIVIAKQTGNDWYVGGMSSWEAHDTEVDLSFLDPEATYTATVLKDGNNASNYPFRYTADTLTVTHETRLPVGMAKGGGFVIRLVKDEEGGTKVLQPKIVSSLSVNKAYATLYIQTENEIQSVAVYNISGQKLLTQSGQAGKNRMEINLANLPEGVYITKIQSEAESDTLKFIY
jgi:alpha-glucosidase